MVLGMEPKALVRHDNHTLPYAVWSLKLISYYLLFPYFKIEVLLMAVICIVLF